MRKICRNNYTKRAIYAVNENLHFKKRVIVVRSSDAWKCCFQRSNLLIFIIFQLTFAFFSRSCTPREHNYGTVFPTNSHSKHKTRVTVLNRYLINSSLIKPAYIHSTAWLKKNHRPEEMKRKPTFNK